MSWVKQIPIRTIFTGFFLILSLIVWGQHNPDNGFMDVHFGKPITFSSRDSSFSLSIGGRIQTMAEGRYDLQTKKGTIDFYIRRLRLNFSGNAINPKFT